MFDSWENLDLFVYQNHSKDINEYQKLNQIMKAQFRAYNFKSIAVWGAGDGNGLEYLSCKRFKHIYAIDINDGFLEECKSKNSNLKCLEVKKLDLSNTFVDLPQVNMVVANLLIEYLGVDTFISQIKNQLISNESSNKPLKIISCVFENKNKAINTTSRYNYEFKDIANLWKKVDELGLIVKFSTLGYDLILKEIYTIDNREYIRLDFKKINMVDDEEN